MSNTIEWHDAHENLSRAERERREQEKRRKKEYKESVDQAYDDMWNALGQEDFRTSDFEDICSDHGIDQDDLLDRLI